MYIQRNLYTSLHKETEGVPRSIGFIYATHFQNASSWALSSGFPSLRCHLGWPLGQCVRLAAAAFPAHRGGRIQSYFFWFGVPNWIGAPKAHLQIRVLTWGMLWHVAPSPMNEAHLWQAMKSHWASYEEPLFFLNLGQSCPIDVFLLVSDWKDAKTFPCGRKPKQAHSHNSSQWTLFKKNPALSQGFAFKKGNITLGRVLFFAAYTTWKARIAISLNLFAFSCKSLRVSFRRTHRIRKLTAWNYGVNISQTMMWDFLKNLNPQEPSQNAAAPVPSLKDVRSPARFVGLGFKCKKNKIFETPPHPMVTKSWKIAARKDEGPHRPTQD